MMSKYDKLSISGIISDACIVTFDGIDRPELFGGNKVPQFLTGTLVQDFKGRFEPGCNFRSSLVQKIEGQQVFTMNSVYCVEGELEYITLDKKYMPLILQYFDPRQVKALIDDSYELGEGGD